MEKQKPHRDRRSGRRGLSGSLGWHREQREAFRKSIERGYSVCDLDFHRPYLASAFDCVLDAEALDSPVRTLGQLVGRKQVPPAVEEGAGIVKCDSLELTQGLVDQSLVALLDAFLVSADFFENPFVLEQAVGMHRGRRVSVAGTDRGPSTISIFEVFRNEASLPGIEVLPVHDDAHDLSGEGIDGPRFNFARLDWFSSSSRSYHFLPFSPWADPLSKGLLEQLGEALSRLRAYFPT